MIVGTAQLAGWCQMVLESLGIPADDAHLVGPLAWCFAEGGWQHNDAMYNPWNTTWVMGGSRPINSARVQAYVSLVQGVAAAVRTLRNGLYGDVIGALRAGDAALLATTVGASPWGTSGSLIAACIPRARQWLASIPQGAPASPAPAPSPSTGGQDVQLPMLEAGATGPAVAAVQLLLNGRAPGAPALAVDGIFGPLTEAHVRAYQTVLHLAVDGIVGPQTWGALLLV